MTLIKQKKIKNSNRGLTFSDKDLGEIGERFSYTIDKENQIVLIHKNETPQENPGTLSRKKVGDHYIPLIDIRNKNAKIFEDAEFLTVSIYETYITIEVYTPNNDEHNTYTKTDVVIDKDELQLTENLNEYDADDILTIINQALLPPSLIQSLQKDLPITLQVAEFFCGAGMLAQGFKDAGFELVFALDFEESATKTYKHNHGDHVITADISEFNKKYSVTAPVIIGGPPCQGFSNANRQTNYLDNPKNQLVKEYIKSIKQATNCQVFVLENVPQLLTAGDGMFKDEIIKELGKDFDIQYGILNAKQYGTAQSRKRAIIIGSRIGRIALPSATHGSPEETQLLPYNTVGEAFIDISDDLPNQKDYSIPKQDTIRRMTFVPQGGNWENIHPLFRNKRMLPGKTQSSVYKRLDPNKPSITITNPRKTIITHPWLHRIISVRECARLFDLPDTFIFTGTLSEKQQQVANGVPAKLGAAIAKRIKTAIMQYNERLQHYLISISQQISRPH